MRSSKVRGNKKPPVKNRVNKASPDELWNFPDTSVADRNSLLEEVKLKCGEPLLHSTALEEDLNRSEDGAAAVEELRVELPEEEKKRRRRSQPAPAVSRRLVGKKPSNRTRAEHALKSATNRRSMKKKQSGSSTRGPQPVGKSRSKRVWSDEEDGDDDEEHREKLSSGGGSSEEEGGGADMRSRKKRRTCVSELDGLVEAFHHFCDAYRKDVESPQDQHNIITLCENVTQLLTERVSASQELRVLKRGNAKTASMIRSKTQRLLDGKNELMKAEGLHRQLYQQRSDLRQRLTDMRRGPAFLRDITTTHLDHGHTHTYGADSLAALLLEARLHERPPPPGGAKTSAKSRK